MQQNYDSQSQLTWIAPDDPIPDVCSSCGMYTDHRVSVRYKFKVARPGESAGCGAVAVFLIIHLALGPIGWLISAMMDDTTDENGTRIVKEKVKLKLAQCQLCHGVEPPQVLDAQDSPRQLLFLVHPKYRNRLDELKRSQ